MLRGIPWAYIFSSGKSKHRVDIQLLPAAWVPSWEPPLRSHSHGIVGNIWGSTSVNCDRKGGMDLQDPTTWILADWAPTCSTQLAFSTSSFAHLNSQDGGTIWPWNSVGYRFAWFRSTKKDLCWPCNLVCLYPGRGAKSWTTLLLSIAPSLAWPRRLARTLGSCTPAILKQAVHLAKLKICRAKSMAIWLGNFRPGSACVRIKNKRPF